MSAFFKAVCALSLWIFFSEAKAEPDLVRIEDSIVGAPYEVIEVDGKPPQRAPHGLFVTVVPLVQISSGSHILTVQDDEAQMVKPKIGRQFLSVTVQAGKRYRLVRENGSPLLVEVQQAKSN